MLNSFDLACSILPLQYRTDFKRYASCPVEEIRLRVGQPISLVINGSEIFICDKSLTDRELLMVIEKITEASMHSAAPSITKGFISYKGLRVGICGTATISGNEVTGFKNFSSAAIRLPHEHHGICSSFIDELCGFKFENTLIISPPGVGKTSLLRELIRILSGSGLRVAVLDERNELSASDAGTAQFDMGKCVDIMIGVPKAIGFQLLLRGMNPQIIAMDEISGFDDVAIIKQIIGCGVSILATAHGEDRHTMYERPAYKELFDMRFFKNFITIKREGENHSYRLEKVND